MLKSVVLVSVTMSDLYRSILLLPNPEQTSAPICPRCFGCACPLPPLRPSVNSSASLSYFRNASAAAVTARAPDFEIAGHIKYQTATRILALFRAQCRFPWDSDFDGP